MPVIIAFSGPRKSGKTAAAGFLITHLEEYGLKPIKLSFADPIKEEFCKLNNIGLDTMYLNDLKESYRDQLITFAEERRKEDPDVFINLLFKKVFAFDWIIIDDLRLVNELKMVLKYDGIPIKVQTDRLKRCQRGFIYDPKVDEHYSESELDLCAQTYKQLGGTVIWNNRTLEDLRTEVGHIAKHLISKKLKKDTICVS